MDRIGWLRAAILGANDGLVSTASLIIGVAAATAGKDAILLAGLAGLAAGAMSMAAGEYVSVSSQADTEKADLARETAELAADPEAEVQELADIYAGRGVAPDLASEIARQMMAHDALGAHARDELGLSDATSARPVLAALTSAVTFSVGAAAPLRRSPAGTVEDAALPPGLARSAKLYGGTERVVAHLTDALVDLGHDVTLFASADAQTRARLVPVRDQAIRLDPAPLKSDLAAHLSMLGEVLDRADDFDVIHFHTDMIHFPLFRQCADTRARLSESRFFKMALRARRRRRDAEVPAWERFALMAYGVTADYGDSIARPLVFFVAMGLVFSLAYWILAALELASAASLDSLGDALRYSLSRMTPFGAMQDQDSWTWLDGWQNKGSLFSWAGLLRITATVQSALALVLTFLFALAVRRRFQIV